MIFIMKNIPSIFRTSLCTAATTNAQNPPTLLAGGQPRKFHGRKRPITTLQIVVIVLSTFFAPARSNAQLPCNGVDTDCVLSPTLPYKCITGPTTFQNQINLGNLEPAAQSGNVVQRIVISGHVTMSLDGPNLEYTFPTGSEIVFANGQSRLTLAGGNALHLIGVKVYGCHEEAIGIRALTNSTFISENCEFSDGLVSIMPGTNISIVGNTFKRSFSHLQFEGGQGTINFVSGGSISGNKFFGDEFLKSPFAGLKPHNGMVISSNITVGKSNGATNEFYDFGDGPAFDGNAIYVTNADVTIVNTTFHSISIGSSLETSGAIYAGPSSSITIQGIGNGPSSPYTFQDCNTGVYNFNSSIDISNAKFKNMVRGIQYSRNSDAWPSASVKINRCHFEGFLRYAIRAEASPFFKFSAFEIQDCFFDDNSIIVTPIPKTAVIVSSLLPSSGEKVKIKNNKIYFRDRSAISSSFALNGITMINHQKGLGENNEFYDEGNGETVAAAYRLDGCSGFVWSNNDVIGNNTVATLGDKGFIVYESPNCVYNCNNMSGTKYGMWFEGMCNSSTLYQNSFNDHNTYGLYFFAEGTVIGGQFKKYNAWGGAPGVAEAYMTFPNYDPFLQSHEFQVKKSLFTPQTNNQNTDFWANPRRVGAIMGNDPHWFVGPTTPTPPSINLCPEETVDPEDPKLDFGEKGIVNGTFIPWQGYAANTWDASLLLYQRMESDSSMRPYGTPEAAWYANNYNGNLGKLARAYDGFVSLSSDAPLASAAQLLTDLNALTLNSEHEQNLKSVLSIFLEITISNSEAMSQQQTDTLNDIADQCRYEGGIGVVLARLALGQSSRRVDDCSSGLRGSGGRVLNVRASFSEVNTSVFPNPAGQSFSVRLDQNVQNGTLRLVNLQGQITRSWEFSGNTVDIQDANVSPGVYFLEVQEQSAILSRNKVVFNR